MTASRQSPPTPFPPITMLVREPDKPDITDLVGDTQECRLGISPLPVPLTRRPEEGPVGVQKAVPLGSSQREFCQ
jgi:hypothetical protein